VSRGALVAAGLAVAALAAIVVFLGHGRSGPGGPPSSSYATAPDGLAAAAELLERGGHDVRRLRAPLDDRPPTLDDTVFVVDGRPLRAAERRTLDRFVARGGHAVLAGPTPIAAAGLRVRSGSVRRGRGTFTLLADSTPLRNRALARDANAALAIRLTGPPARRVAFVESIHGYAQATGLAALPGGVQRCLLLLGLAALAWMVARGRRLGPPETESRELAPPRRLHVEALAAALRRTKDRDEAPAIAARRAGLHHETTTEGSPR
jgi:hypothetical protein